MTSLAGTGSLMRLAVRRDRVILAAFVGVLVLSVAASAYATIELYPDAAAQAQAVAAINGATSTLALYGPIHDQTSLGALSTFKVGMMGAVAVCVLTLFLVVRHTRTEEETGRLELLGGTVVGRHAPLTAGLVVAGAAAFVSGLGTAVGLIAVGLPVGGSILMGLGYACLGLAFASIAGLAAQLVRSARTASGIAVAVLGASYLLRAVGDASSGKGLAWISWPSPLGLWHATRPYAGDRWWILSLLVALSAAVIAAAYSLGARRDFGSGLLPERAGRADAAPTLRSPLALGWRLQRGSLAAWSVAFAIVGLVVGGLASNAGDFLTSPQAKEFIAKLGGAQTLTDAFLSVELGFAGVFAAVFGMQAVMRLRSEEAALRGEPVLAAPVTRMRWAWSYLTVALGGTLILLLVLGLAAGSVRAAQAGELDQFGRMVVAALVRLPAVWVMIGIALALFGVAPRWMALGWVILVGFLLLGELGPLFGLSPRVMDISPFSHIPRLPGGGLTATPLLWLTAAAALLIVIGLVGFRRRDVG